MLNMNTWLVLEEEEPEATGGLRGCLFERPEGDEVIAHADCLHGDMRFGLYRPFAR